MWYNSFDIESKIYEKHCEVESTLNTSHCIWYYKRHSSSIVKEDEDNFSSVLRAISMKYSIKGNFYGGFVSYIHLKLNKGI